MKNIAINDLWVLVTYNYLTQEPDIYPRIFTDKEEAESVAKEFGYVVKAAFINS